MHLADGTLSPPIIAATATGAGLAVMWGAWRLVDEDLIRCGLFGALVLTASLIHIPMGGTSVHLLGLGIIGAVLGKRVFPALAASLVLQALFLGYGGIGTLGASILAMGIPAWLAGLAIRRIPRATGLVAGISAFVAVQMAAGFVALWLTLSGGHGVGWIFLVAHQPVALIEALVTAGCISYLAHARPQLIGRTEEIA